MLWQPKACYAVHPKQPTLGQICGCFGESKIGSLSPIEAIAGLRRKSTCKCKLTACRGCECIALKSHARFNFHGFGSREPLSVYVQGIPEVDEVVVLLDFQRGHLRIRLAFDLLGLESQNR